MLKINDSYSIIKGWPKLNQCVVENKPSVPAYIVDKERLNTCKLTFEEYKIKKAKRLELEEQIKINDQLAAEGKDTDFKKFFNLEHMIYSDIKDVPYPSAYDGDKTQEIYQAETVINEIEIDDYVKALLTEYLNSHDDLKTSLDKLTDEPIWVIKRPNV